MVYGLPSYGDTPIDPHSAFTHLKSYPIDGGLVDGPVYGSIYNNLIGIKLYQPDEYANFQSKLAVYHDDYGDYSTNEPTMDGTASLVYLLAAKEAEANPGKNKSNFSRHKGAIIRGDSTKKTLALVFTGHEFADGGNIILKTLENQKVKASFFLTGKFYKEKSNEGLVKQLAAADHFLGNHSEDHLLYCDWGRRDSLLVSKKTFLDDLLRPNQYLKQLRTKYYNSKNLLRSTEFFLPPYEWYNDSISRWCAENNIQIINNTPGTKSHADYTVPGEKNYRSSQEIYHSIIDYDSSHSSGLNGFLLLMHIGTDPGRTDKFYHKLVELITYLKSKGYQFQTVDKLLGSNPF